MLTNFVLSVMTPLSVALPNCIAIIVRAVHYEGCSLELQISLMDGLFGWLVGWWMDGWMNGWID